MNYLKTKKFRLLLAMISLLVLVNVIQDSYAKYISSASANSSFSIAQWTFKVNDQDVLNQSDFSSTIVPVIDSNDNIKEGYIAPTSSGYFDIIVDCSEVGVSFSQSLTLTAGDDSIEDLIITGYQLNGGETIAFTGDDYTISLNHYLDNATTTYTYRFFVEWIDGTGEAMNNAQDTEAAENGTASVGVNLQFIQIAN